MTSKGKKFKTIYSSSYYGLRPKAQRLHNSSVVFCIMPVGNQWRALVELPAGDK